MNEDKLELPPSSNERMKRSSAVALQDHLLRAAVEMLAPGGTLVFSTCSLQPEEGEMLIAKLLANVCIKFALAALR